MMISASVRIMRMPVCVMRSVIASIVMRAVMFCSAMLCVSANIMRSVALYITVFVITCRTLFRYACLIRSYVFISKTCCTKFNILVGIAEIMVIIIIARYKPDCQRHYCE